MKKSKLLKTATTVRTLANLQTSLAIKGDHTTAWEMGPEVQFHVANVAKSYLGHTKIPLTPAGELVKEIAFSCVFADPERENTRLISLLRTSMHDNSAEGIKKLRRAKRQLPDLDVVVLQLEKKF